MILYGYIIPLIVCVLCYIFITYTGYCRATVLSFLACILPLINIFWAITLVALVIEYLVELKRQRY